MNQAEVEVSNAKAQKRKERKGEYFFIPWRTLRLGALALEVSLCAQAEELPKFRVKSGFNPYVTGISSYYKYSNHD
jgi:hypothetical protein